MKERKKGLIIGIFLCVLIAIATAARYEDVAFTQVRVKQFLSLKSGSSIKFNETVSLTKTISTTGDTTLNGDLITPLTSVTVTNNDTITVASRVLNVTGIGQADNFTNAITLANAIDGQWVTLVVNASSTNLISLADSGINKLTGAIVLDNDDNVTLLGVGTNWVQVVPAVDN